MRVFITGMSGTLGTALAKEHHARGDFVFGCSRNEEKCSTWVKENDYCGTLYCCDCAGLIDLNSDMGRLLPSMNRVYHCAAMKHVDLCEKNPSSAMYQNVALTMSLAASCEEDKVPFYFVSSDKACLPTGVYGATKLMAEKITVAYGGAAVRFGNLIGSSGSVFRLWTEALQNGHDIKVTDPDMTRYFYPIHQAVKFLIDESVLGAVAIPTPMLSARIGDIAEVYREMGAQISIVGKRPGETTHQYLIAPDSHVDASSQVKYLLRDGATEHLRDGLCSNWCKRWDIIDLMKEAGVPVPER